MEESAAMSIMPFQIFSRVLGRPLFVALAHTRGGGQWTRNGDEREHDKGMIEAGNAIPWLQKVPDEIFLL